MVIEVGAEQTRPVLAKITVQDNDGKTQLLRAGEIWIKKNTGLSVATRDDLEALYDTRIEAEAERRAGNDSQLFVIR